MDDAGDRQDDQEGISEVVGDGNAVVGGKERDVCERLEMAGNEGGNMFPNPFCPSIRKINVRLRKMHDTLINSHDSVLNNQ